MVTVIGLLAVIAVPQYNDFVVSSRRTDAQAMLFEIAQQQQQFFSVQNTFTTNIIADLGLVLTSPDGYYTATAAAGTSGSIVTSYLLTAIPAAGGPQVSDTGCLNLTLNSLGVKADTGSLSSDQCWKN